MSALPSGTVTFLFSDVEGSTRRWQDEPDAMRALLTEHDAIWRDLIDKHRGHLFKHTGDGVAAVFASAADAVHAALDAQARLADVLPVRVGLHTGEAELRDGDYFGSTLNRCARLMGIAHGGQVVVSEATAALVRERDDLHDLGEHRLRDLSRAERVWQVGVGAFAALRSLTAASTNLPLLLSSFVGRDAEMAELVAAVGDSRLVTLTGVGGVGKTRLALQVAAEVLPRFADGVWLCELAAAANDDDMVQVVALALGVVQRQQMTLGESIVDSSRNRELLVVLDNCEHLLDAATDLVEDMLAGAPKVRVLATSREGFGIPGETVRPLRSLAVADRSGQSSDAVVLFAERARAVVPSFVLDAESLPAAVELCRRLDGIPLAIELAAARVATMSPADMVGHLDERFRLLTGGRRGRVERHQTLRAAIEWSYSLLDDRERTVFDRLGVFPGSFDENAAVAVCATNGVERWDVIDALAGLAAKSMIGAERDGTSVRYQLLETLRHFARDHADDLDALRRRHAAHYATVAEQMGAGLLSSDELAWRPRLGIELDNLRAAVGWAFDAATVDDVEIGVQVIDALVFEAMVQPSWGMQTWTAPLLGRVSELDAAARATVHSTASYRAQLAGEYERSVVFGRRALGDLVAFTPAYYVAMGLVSAAEVFNDPPAVMALLGEARGLLLAEGGPDDWRTCCLHNVTSYVAGIIGDRDLARTEAHRSVAVARRLAIPTVLAMSLTLQASALCIDDPRAALAAADEAIGLYDKGAGEVMLPAALMDAAVLRSVAGDAPGAARAAGRAVDQGARNGDQSCVASAVKVATLVLAASREGGEAPAILNGARHGPALGNLPTTHAGIHRERIDAALDHVARTLGPDAYNAAQQRGAAMTYDEIIAYTLDQLSRLVENVSSDG